MLRVAIDGPGGTGKSTIAKEVAKLFNLEYIDTGAMYRAVALKAIGLDISCDDVPAVQKMLETTEIDFDGGKILLDGKDVGDSIRTNEISMGASNFSKIACVREKVNKLNKHLASTKNVIMEGRDIGTNVITDAEVKIFMTAAPEVRAKRRFNQLQEQGKAADFDKILKEIQERDYQDSHRELNPLKQADDAVFLDSSEMSFEENIKAVADIINSKISG